MKKRHKEIPDFMKEALEKGLTDYEKRELESLRSMIYDKRGGEIEHPVLNMLRGMKKTVEKETKRLKETGQAKLI